MKGTGSREGQCQERREGDFQRGLRVQASGGERQTEDENQDWG